METIKVAFSNDTPQEIHFSFVLPPEFHAIINIPADVAFEGEQSPSPGAKCILRENHFLKCVKITRTSLGVKSRTQFL